MFDDVDEKLKEIGRLFFLLGIIVGIGLVIYALVIKLYGILIWAVVAFFCCLLTSYLLYALGELLECAYSIKDNIEKINKNKD